MYNDNVYMFKFLYSSYFSKNSEFLKDIETSWRAKLYRPSEGRLSVKLVPTFGDRVCRVVSATDPYSRILDF
jgi:hypothetical protein